MDPFLLRKTNLVFGGVHVYVNYLWVHFEIHKEDRVQPPGRVVCGKHGIAYREVAHRPAVYEQKLVSAPVAKARWR